jgi:hypothetical protein
MGADQNHHKELRGALCHAYTPIRNRMHTAWERKKYLRQA